jgi:hypothetical protein
VDSGLVRGTAKERAETNQILRLNGVISANEWRDEEDYPRLSDPEMDKPKPATNLYGVPTESAKAAEVEEGAKSEPLQLHVKVESPVTVNPPAVHFKADAPQVTVEAPQVHVAPAEVKVDAPQITVQHLRGGKTVKSIKYDDDGNIESIVEDEAE